MDLFHPAYWSGGLEAYRNYHAIYPPLGHLVLKLLRNPIYYASDGFAGRDNDTFLLAVYLLSALALGAVFCCSRLRHPSPWPERVSRALILSLSAPFLFALERGNLIMWCFPLVYLTVRWLQRGRAMPAAVALGFAISLKPYLLVLMGAFLAERQWRALALSVLWAGLVYLGAYLAYGSGSPMEILHNIHNFSNPIEYPWMERFYLTWNVAEYLKLDKLYMPLGSLVGTREWDAWLGLCRVLYYGSFAALGTCFAAAWRKGLCTMVDAMIVLASMLYLLHSTVGPYFLTFIIVLIMAKGQEIWARPSTWLLLLACLPMDIPAVKGVETEVFSWVSQSSVGFQLNLTFGEILRPVLFSLFSLSFALEFWLGARSTARP